MQRDDIDLATRVTLVRHGRTAWNLALRLQGQTDIPLDEIGQWQAERAAEALQGEDAVAVYTSDLGRARFTAAPIARVLGVSLLTEVGLRERHFGEMEGKTIAELNAEDSATALSWRRRDLDHVPAGGESVRAFHERAVAAVTALARQHQGNHIVVVTHGGVLDAMYRAGSKVDLNAPRSWHIGNASIHRMLLSAGGWTVVGWNDEFHLDAELPEGLAPQAGVAAG